MRVAVTGEGERGQQRDSDRARAVPQPRNGADDTGRGVHVREPTTSTGGDEQLPSHCRWSIPQPSRRPAALGTGEWLAAATFVPVTHLKPEQDEAGGAACATGSQRSARAEGGAGSSADDVEANRRGTGRKGGVDRLEEDESGARVEELGESAPSLGGADGA